MSSPYTTFGLPPDGVAWATLAAACALVPALRRKTLFVSRSVLVPALALGAALLSAGYVAYYLRGGPRIIDATSYYLQARGMARGFFAFPVPEPSGSFRGRFLLENATHSLAVIFPPGYAAVLAAGFAAHAPMAIGPLIGCLLVLTTYALAREVSRRSDVAVIAAALSMICAALRYHTADTMSHGLCALLLCVGTWLALRGRRWDALWSGLACGWLLATRPVSGLLAVLVAGCAAPRTLRSALGFSAGLLPGLALLLSYQHAATGSYLTSTQLAYYALADGPQGCFRYGFGQGIGCLSEHGEYVRARLPNGYGLAQAASVTVRRLAVHCIDIANAAPLALLVPVGAWVARGARGVRIIFFGCLGLICAYAPFYFDGSYPGGGARLFADILPLEHVLLALAIVRLRASFVALPLSLAGFALHASFSHRALAEREGGRPMFEASVLTQAHVDRGLVFIDTDHGFNLAHDPGQLDATRSVVVARFEHDAHDFELWSRLGHPPSYRYLYDPMSSAAQGKLVPFLPPSSTRFEAESDWPPLALEGGWVGPDFRPCASGGRGLRLHPASPTAGMSIDLELSGTGADHAARHIRVGWIRDDGPETTLTLSSSGFPETARSAAITRGGASCSVADFGIVILSAGAQRVRLWSSRSGVLDYLDLQP